MSLTPKDKDLLDRLIAIEKSQRDMANGVRMIRPNARFLPEPGGSTYTTMIAQDGTDYDHRDLILTRVHPAESMGNSLCIAGNAGTPHPVGAMDTGAANPISLAASALVLSSGVDVLAIGDGYTVDIIATDAIDEGSFTTGVTITNDILDDHATTTTYDILSGSVTVTRAGDGTYEWTASVDYDGPSGGDVIAVTFYADVYPGPLDPV